MTTGRFSQAQPVWVSRAMIMAQGLMFMQRNERRNGTTTVQIRSPSRHSRRGPITLMTIMIMSTEGSRGSVVQKARLVVNFTRCIGHSPNDGTGRAAASA